MHVFSEPYFVIHIGKCKWNVLCCVKNYSLNYYAMWYLYSKPSKPYIYPIQKHTLTHTHTHIHTCAHTHTHTPQHTHTYTMTYTCTHNYERTHYVLTCTRSNTTIRTNTEINRETLSYVFTLLIVTHNIITGKIESQMQTQCHVTILNSILYTLFQIILDIQHLIWFAIKYCTCITLKQYLVYSKSETC